MQILRKNTRIPILNFIYEKSFPQKCTLKLKMLFVLNGCLNLDFLIMKGKCLLHYFYENFYTYFEKDIKITCSMYACVN